MSSDRLARALLRLYPRAWRERYGDEFLALIVDGGLTWREVVDVIGAAGVERIRAAGTFIRAELDPTDPPAALVSLTGGFRETLLFAALTYLTIGAMTFAGVPLPASWTYWFWLLFQPSVFQPSRQRASANWHERACLSYFWFVGTVGVTGLCWSLARALAWSGAPQLSDRAFFSFIGAFFGGLILRAIYCVFRMLIYGSTWRGMYSHEILAWRVGMLAVVMTFANVDPVGQTFWVVTMLVAMSLKTPYELTRQGSARRRAQFEEAERFWTK